MAEWQRDRTRTETVPGLMEVARVYGRAYALQAQPFAAHGGGA